MPSFGIKIKLAYIAVLIEDLEENGSGIDTIAEIGRLVFDSLTSEWE